MDDHRTDIASLDRVAGREHAANGDFDALADLFLGGSRYGPAPVVGVQAGDDRERSPIETTEEPVRTSPVEVEAVVLGHLPVRAGIWVKQYASTVAQQRGQTVGLVRCAAGTTSIELIGSRDRLRDLRELEQEPTLAAIARARRVVEHWIVRVGETDEPTIGEYDAIGRITVLSGADEAAVVATYRLIKSIAARWDVGERDTYPTIAVAVMGSGSQAAAEASAKISRAAAAFLDQPLETTPGTAQIGAPAGTASVLIHRAQTTLDTSELFRGLAGKSATDHPGPALRLAGTPTPHADELDRLGTLPSDAEIVVGPRGGAHPGRMSNAEHDRSGQAAPAGFARSRTPASGLIDGLMLLESRCPAAPGVELAADAEGALHLIADGLESMASLSAARTWAREHLPLLARAEPLLSQDRASQSHVVVDRFAGAGPVTGGDVRVHLIRAVDTPAGSGYVAIELDT